MAARLYSRGGVLSVPRGRSTSFAPILKWIAVLLVLLSFLFGRRAYVVAHTPPPHIPTLTGITVAFDGEGGEHSYLGTVLLKAYHNEGASAPAPGQQPQIVLHYFESGPRGRFDHIGARINGQFADDFIDMNFGVQNLPKFLDETEMVLKKYLPDRASTYRNLIRAAYAAKN